MADDELEDNFDMADAAAELEEASRGTDEGAEDGEAQESDDIEIEPQKAAPTSKAGVADEEDDEKFLAANQGKAIPYTAFQKKYAKWKQRYEEAAAFKAERDTLKAEYEGYKKVQPFTPQQQAAHKQYEDFYGKLRTGTKNMPFLSEAIVALGRGQTPDLRKFHQALGEYVEALPQGDPRQIQLQQELTERLDRMEEAEFDRSFHSHIESENTAVKKLLGDNPDPEMEQLIETVFLKMMPERGTLKDMPSKVEIAKLLLARDQKLEQRILKKQIPVKAARRSAAIPSGGGPAATSKAEDALPDFDDVEAIGQWIQRGSNKQ